MSAKGKCIKHNCFPRWGPAFMSIFLQGLKATDRGRSVTQCCFYVNPITMSRRENISRRTVAPSSISFPVLQFPQVWSCSELTLYDPSLGSKDSPKDEEWHGSPQVPHPPERQAQLLWGPLLTALWCTGLPWYLYARRSRKSQGLECCS